MPPKRPSEAIPTGAQLKRQRMRDQRSISVQGHDARKGGSAASGNTGLPAVLEVEKFAQARVFEISAMQRAMKAAKEAGTQRAFQSLPRHLRRRAASHNIRRLPTRLRERARGEVPKDAARPKRVTRKMLGRHRTRPGLKAEMFRTRQQGKMWLETHVWHAKRMHMTEIWGHRLAERPTAKAFRSSYRASQHGALVHDASYYQYFELEGLFSALEQLLQVVCDPAAPLPSSKRYSTGARECTTNVYDAAQTFPHGLLGPAAFIWQPEFIPPASPAPSTSAATFTDPTRTVLVRVHPAVARAAALSFEHALRELRLGLHVALRRYQGEFLTFEVTGRRATEVVKAVLKPVKGTDDATMEAWRKLDPAAGPGGVPAGMVLGLEVYDPRLSFPPKLDKQSVPLDPASLLVPSPALAALPLFWSPSHRASIRTPRYKKRDLDARRSHHLVPGTRLSPLAQDDRVPVLLSQRELGTGESALHGWTLTLPAGWGMPFWASLVYCTPRVGALRERAHQSYEAGATRFPEDFVGAPGFDECEARREDDERGYWERRPPAKRPSYAKLGTRSPWRVEMGDVLRKTWQRGTGAAEVSAGVGTQGSFLVPHTVAKAVLVHGRKPVSAIAEDISSSPRARAKQLEHQLAHEWAGLSATPSATPGSAALLPLAMVRVKLVPCMRGVPEDLGLVYELDEETARVVRDKMDRAEKGKGREVRATGEFDGAEDLCNPPSPDQVIGRITTGSFSLSSGRGGGVAVLSLYRLLAMSERGPGLDRLVLFRNRDSETYRAATVQLAALMRLLRALASAVPSLTLAAAQKANTWEVVGTAGISPQQVFAVGDSVFIVDKVENNPATVTSTSGVTHPAWAGRYDVNTNEFTPMDVVSNAFCAGGNVLGNGSWVNVGGNARVTTLGFGIPEGGDNPYGSVDGGKAVRMLTPGCAGGSCEWTDDIGAMPLSRWYPTVETLPTGDAIIIGGELYGSFVNTPGGLQNVPTAEYWPTRGEPFNITFLEETMPVNLYPLTWLMSDGRIFLQAGWQTTLLDYENNVEERLPNITHAQRPYPAGAGTAMLPMLAGDNYTQTIVFAGGMTPEHDDWNQNLWHMVDTPASNSLVAITPLAANPTWMDLDNLPEGRSMGNLILLPDKRVLLLNGAAKGSEGYGWDTWAQPYGQSYAQDPVLRPAYLNTSAPAGSMWDTGVPASTIPRMYHSVATLLNDGSVWVGGSNPNVDVITEANNASYPYKTEFRVERFYPSYYDLPRPETGNLPSTVTYGGAPIDVSLPASSVAGVDLERGISVMLMRFGFSTHVMNMGARAVELPHTYTSDADGSATLHVSPLPPNPALFVPGPAVMFVVVDGVPSRGHDLMVGSGELGVQPTAPAVALPESSGPRVVARIGAGGEDDSSGACGTTGAWRRALAASVMVAALA
ncbi:hypothetical protein JCM3770_005322 [Rhodotorula araucariae]